MRQVDYHIGWVIPKNNFDISSYQGWKTHRFNDDKDILECHGFIEDLQDGAYDDVLLSLEYWMTV